MKQITKKLGNVSLNQTAGRTSSQVNLTGNYFKVTQADKNDDVYMYKINLPELDEFQIARVRKRAVYCMLEHHCNETQTGINLATDFAQWIVTRYPLPQFSTSLEFPYWQEDSTPARARQNYTAEVQHHATIRLSDLLNDCAGAPQMNGAQKGDIITALNLMFSRRPYKHAQLTPASMPTVACLGLAKSIDLSGTGTALGGGLVMHGGIRRGIRAASSVLLNVNTYSMPFYQQGTLAALVTANDHRTARRWRHLGQFLKGCKIRTNHLRAKHGTNYLEKIYAIKDMARPDAPNQDDEPTVTAIGFNWDRHPQGPRWVSLKDYYLIGKF